MPSIAGPASGVRSSTAGEGVTAVVLSTRSRTTSVPAARSPSRRAWGWKNIDTTPGPSRSRKRTMLRTSESPKPGALPSMRITRRPITRLPGVRPDDAVSATTKYP